MRFKKVYIEITNSCNLRCDFCPSHKREESFLSIEQFEEILEKLQNFTEYLYFHLMGEPLLHPLLKDFLQLSKNKGFKVNLTTNGTLLNQAYFLQETDYQPRQINISLHSLSQFEKEKRDGYVREIMQFVNEIQKNSGTFLTLRLWNLNSPGTLDNFNAEILDYLVEFGGVPKEEWVLTARNGSWQIKERVYLHFDEYFVWPDLNNDIHNEKGICHGLRDHLGILADGTVVPCCLDGEGLIDLGNIFADEIEDILRKPEVLRMLKGFSERKLSNDLCKHCGFIKRFS